MQFYDSAGNKQGICSEIDRLCDTNDTSYPRVDKTSRVNNALEEIVGLLINADGTWQFDDTNYSTNPVGTGNLTEGQESYSFSDKFLDIEQVEILDVQGIYRKIEPLDYKEIPMGLSAEEYFGSTTSVIKKGWPQYYDKQGNTIRLFPAPTSTIVTLTAGIRIRFKRTASLFTVASGTTADTTEPGFASLYHPILAYMAALPYCIIYKKDRVPALIKYIDETKKEIVKFYSNREKDKRKIITPAFVNPL